MPSTTSPTPGELPDEFFVTADELFGDRLSLAEQYAEILATDGVVRGLIGPRETTRIWDRHVLNCAVVQSLIPDESYVADVGSGAGLPGIPLALARPDLRLVLIEPLLRRVTFLDEVIARLGLAHQVEVVRGRAEETATMFHVKQPDIATARAVAPLDRLAGWTLPLVRDGGCLLAMKGSTASEEIAEHRAAIESLGGVRPTIETCGVGLLPEPTTVVRIVRDASATSRAGDSRIHGGRATGSGRRVSDGMSTTRGAKDSPTRGRRR